MSSQVEIVRKIAEPFSFETEKKNATVHLNMNNYAGHALSFASYSARLGL